MKRVGEQRQHPSPTPTTPPKTREPKLPLLSEVLAPCRTGRTGRRGRWTVRLCCSWSNQSGALLDDRGDLVGDHRHQRDHEQRDGQRARTTITTSTAHGRRDAPAGRSNSTSGLSPTARNIATTTRTSTDLTESSRPPSQYASSAPTAHEEADVERGVLRGRPWTLRGGDRGCRVPGAPRRRVALGSPGAGGSRRGLRACSLGGDLVPARRGVRRTARAASWSASPRRWRPGLVGEPGDDVTQRAELGHDRVAALLQRSTSARSAASSRSASAWPAAM